MSRFAHDGTVLISLILIPIHHRLVPCVGQSSTRWPQTMPWPIRHTKLRAPTSVFSPGIRRARGLKRAQGAHPMCHRLPERQQEGTVQPQVQPCTLRSQNHGHRAVGGTDGQPSLIPPATAAGPPAGRAPGWGTLPARPATTWRRPPRSPAKPRSVAGSGYGRCACTGWSSIPGRTADAGRRSRQAARDRCRCGACVWHRNGAGGREHRAGPVGVRNQYQRD